VRLLLAALVVAALAAPASGAARPRVRLMDLTPASVAGTGFRGRERVLVTVTGSSGRLRRAVVTSAGGAFVVRFARAVSTAGCNQLAISAVGAKGDRAYWKSPPKACGPPPQPIAP
jgi:uncharacterized protein YbjT (DUF2867 family)